MVYAIVRHTIEDYDRWRPIFDADAENRKQAGSQGGYVFRNRANPNELFVLIDYADAEKFEAFASSPELREAMGRAGVVGAPDIAVLDLVDRPEA
jgi:quinol monooxygenase YgiN